MTEGSDEQDLVKALDSVADAAASVGGVPASSTATATLNSPVPATSGPVDSPFPSIFPESSTQSQLSPSVTLNPPTPGPLLDTNETTASTAPTLPPDTFGPVNPTVPEAPATPEQTPTPAVSTEAFEPIVPTLPPEPTALDTSAEPVIPAVPETTESSDTITPVASTQSESSDAIAPVVSTPPESEKPAEDNGPLASIKKDVLVELRPLVDKLSVSPEEKFDTLLLLIRSTDDSTLIEPAHEAAKAITDETRRAEALLDIVKEIDYLTRQKSDES
ncbi:MAG: hypothetical protein H6797_05685 [Candidatus Nomurabacteria bacterium]|nr:MAG: hypothetical protein H6797_05685 [Candidatus Nomurabacteria bacterium]